MSDALSILSSHFNALQPVRVEVPGLPFPLMFKPLNGEQAVKLGRATADKNSKSQSKAFAELLVDTVTLENGQPAFPFVKGGEDPVKTLTTGIAPKVFTTLCNALLDSISTEAANDLEKKSEELAVVS